MVVVGGVTRLTHSGLSIVEWQPLVGTLPPLDDADWAADFDKYKLTPEFRLRNHDMTLDGLQGHLLVGVLPPPARARSSAWSSSCPCSGSGARAAGPAARAEARGHLRARGAAGRDGLVHGEERPGGRSAREPVPARPRTWASRSSSSRPCSGSALGLLRPRAHGRARALRRGAASRLPPGVRDGAHGRARRRHPRRLRLQHLAAHERRTGSRPRLMIEPWWTNFGYNMATVQFVHRTLALVVLACAWLLAWRVLASPRGEWRIARRRRHAGPGGARAGVAGHRHAPRRGAGGPRCRAPGRRGCRPRCRALACPLASLVLPTSVRRRMVAAEAWDCVSNFRARKRDRRDGPRQFGLANTRLRPNCHPRRDGGAALCRPDGRVPRNSKRNPYPGPPWTQRGALGNRHDSSLPRRHCLRTTGMSRGRCDHSMRFHGAHREAAGKSITILGTRPSRASKRSDLACRWVEICGQTVWLAANFRAPIRRSRLRAQDRDRLSPIPVSPLRRSTGMLP